MQQGSTGPVDPDRLAAQVRTLGTRRRGAGRESSIKVVERLARILALFTTGGPQLRLGDVSIASHLQRSTVHRYLTSLTGVGLLRQDGDGLYGLGPLLVQLGTAAVGGIRVVNLAQVYLQRLAEETQETAVMSVWAGQGPVVVRVQDPQNKLVQIRVRIGALLPVDSAQSQVFLAFLPDPAQTQRVLGQLPDGARRELERQIDDARACGVAINSRVVQGIRAVAVPVFDHEVIVATLALVGTVAAIPADRNSGLVKALKNAAQQLSYELGRIDGATR